jgi:hypothetical protein
MAVLTNTRHETFAQELAKGSSKAAAYEKAGYAPDTGNASKLTANHRVAMRVAELQQGSVELTKITVATLVGMADEVRGLALADKQHSAAVGAIKEMGILTGLRIDRREVGSPGEFDRLSDEELQRFIDAETAKLIELPNDES